MFRTIADLKACTIGATDGDIGSIEDVYFDDESWTVRYLVVDTGTWLPDRKVLISPLSFRKDGHESERLLVHLTKDQVRNSPEMDRAQPISRQAEVAYSQYYGYLPYWEGPYRWGAGPYPLPGDLGREREGSAQTAVGAETMARDREQRLHGREHLRSADEVMDYYIQATDGEIGHLDELIVDDRDWAIRYLAVDTRNWFPGKKVLIAPAWIERISYDESKVFVGLPRDAIRNSPQYDPAALDRQYESQLYQHYGKHGYWDDKPESWRIFPPSL
jgi:hypothetical protein